MKLTTETAINGRLNINTNSESSKWKQENERGYNVCKRCIYKSTHGFKIQDSLQCAELII
jgi:hypothetical protein